MSPTISVRIFITVYKNVPYLQKVLDSIELQNYRNFAVSILEDGDSDTVKNFIKNIHYSYPIQHIQQEDIGFRKNKILNKGIENAMEDLIIFLDEDCMLHPNFVENYVKNYKEDTVLFAKRVNIDKITTEKLLSSKSCKPSFLSLFLNKANHIEDGFYIPLKRLKTTNKPSLLGCNMAIPLKILKAVNGFDEDYELPGYGEDSDIQWRIQKAGYKFINTKYHTVQYHLFHERPQREDQTSKSREIYLKKIELGEVFCKNGLVKNVGF